MGYHFPTDEEIVDFFGATSGNTGLMAGACFLMICLNVFLWKVAWRKWQELDLSGSGDKEEIEWNQGMEELEMAFPLPSKGLTSKDVECKITTNAIRLGFKGERRPELEGQFYAKVIADESIWQMVPIGKPTHVKLTLVKAAQGMWPSVMKDGQQQAPEELEPKKTR